MRTDIDENLSLGELTEKLNSNEPRERIQAVMSIAKKGPLPVEALLAVARHRDDKGEFDPNPGSIGFVKYVSTVRGCVQQSLPRMLRESPVAVAEIVSAIADMPEADRPLAIELLTIAPAEVVQDVLKVSGPSDREQLAGLEVVLLEHRGQEAAQQFLRKLRREVDEYSALSLAELETRANVASANPFLAAAQADALEKKKYLDEAKGVYERVRAASPDMRVQAWAGKEVDRLRVLLKPLSPDEVAQMTSDAIGKALQKNPWRVLDALAAPTKVADSRLRGCLGKIPAGDMRRWVQRISDPADPRRRLLHEICEEWHRSAAKAFLIGGAVVLLVVWVGAGLLYTWAPESFGGVILVGILGLMAFFGLAAWAMNSGAKYDILTTVGGARRGTRMKLVTAGFLACFAATAVAFVAADHHYVHTHPYKQFDRWGLTFSYPRARHEPEQKSLDNMASATRGQNPALVHMTMLEAGNDAPILVMIERREPNETGEQALAARRRQMDEAIRSGDVIRVNWLELTTWKARPAIAMDVERRELGRGRNLDILFDQNWVVVSLILGNRTNTADVERAYNRILETLEYRP